MAIDLRIRENGSNGNIRTVEDVVDIERDDHTLICIDKHGEDHDFYDGRVVAGSDHHA